MFQLYEGTHHQAVCFRNVKKRKLYSYLLHLKVNTCDQDLAFT
jgi:hypothetical protein